MFANMYPGKGLKVPVEHDEMKHNTHPVENRGSRSGMTYQQKEYIATKARSRTKMDTFAAELLHKKDIQASIDQKRNPVAFKTCVSQFIQRNPKYCGGNPVIVMKMNIVVEIIEFLKIPPQDRSDDAPVGKSNDSYYHSNGWKLYI